jgi:hypothetical protein
LATWRNFDASAWRDIIYLDGRGHLVVVTHLEMGQDGNDAIRFVSVDGQHYFWRCLVGVPPGMYARVGLDCEPSLAGRRAFIAERSQQPGCPTFFKSRCEQRRENRINLPV